MAMGTRAVSLRMIEAFRAVVLGGGITKAAQLLHVSQPTVSRLVADLEARLRLPLFERRGTGVVPTAEGMALYAEVDAAFSGLDRVLAAAARIREKRSGLLRIASMPTFALAELADAVATVARRFPGVFVQVEMTSSSVARQRVINGDAELAFATLPPDAQPLKLLRRYSGDCVCILPARHALRESKVVRPRLLADVPMIGLSPTTLTGAEVDAHFRAAGIERRKIVAETPQSAIASDLVLCGLGVAIVDPFTARRHLARGGVVRPFRPQISFELGCLCRDGSGVSEASLALLEALDDSARRSVAPARWQ